METRFGFSLEEWDRAREEMRQILIRHAKQRKMIPYSELVQQVNTIRLEANDYALAAMLDEISTDEDEAGHGLLTVLVVHKTGDHTPGPGFFELARQRGRSTSDILRTWAEELTKVIDYWSKH